MVRRAKRFAMLFGGLAPLCLAIAAPAQGSHPRPKGATPMRFSFVPAYSQCTAPNRTHGPPLSFPSCNPPAQTSGQATVGTPDAYGGAANFNGQITFNWVGGVAGPPDDADVLVYMTLNDVRCVPAGARCGGANNLGPADYSGEIRFGWDGRISDHFNGATQAGGADPATVVDFSFEHASACAETASTSVGSTCNVTTSVNAIMPDIAKEKRMVWEFGQPHVDDGGADGDGDTTADNTVFLRSGVFIP